MATVNKDFRIKAGLVVEGANATVNGEDILTTGSTTSDLAEGTNLYFTEQRAVDAVADEIDSAVSTAINALDTDDIEEGATNQYFTNQRALDATAAAYDPAGSATTAETNANTYTDTAINGLDTGDIEEGANLYFTNQRALDATSSAYDTAGAAATAESNANTYTDTAINGLDTDDIEEGTTNKYFTNQRALDATASAYDAAGAAATAESNANTYTDTALEDYTPTSSLDATIDGYGYLKSADLSGYATESYVGTAIDNLVDGAPGLLDTLNEIAAAINDDANYATTMTTALAGKQNSLTAGDNISIVSDTISVTGLDSTDISDFNTAALSATASAYDVAGAAAAAQTAAESYADGLASNYEAAGAAQAAVDALDTDDIEEGVTNLYFTDERAVDAVSGSDIYPNAVIINNVSKNVATTQAVASASTVSALTWNKSDYKSAKLVVKAKTASHSQVSEIIVTLDASDNVAITEFGIVYTDGELATVTADVVLSDVRIRVTTLNASTDVTVVGMLLL